MIAGANFRIKLMWIALHLTPFSSRITLGRMVAVHKHPRMPWLAMIDPGGVVPGMERFLCSYVLLHRKVAIVDVGPSCCVSSVMEGLKALGIAAERVDFLLTSHVHLDHGGGVGAALKLLPNARAVVHPNGLPHLQNPWKLWETTLKALGDLGEAYGRPDPAPPERLIAARDGMRIDLGVASLEVLFTPGHAPHHISFFDHEHSFFLAGDLCGVRARGIRRPASPPPLYLDQQLSSIDHAVSLNPSVICYGHYGWESDAMARLRAYQRQLLAWRDIVAEGLEAGQSPEQTARRIVDSDKKLARLGRLTPLQQRHEMTLILNAVAGLAGHLDREKQTTAMS